MMHKAKLYTMNKVLKIIQVNKGNSLLSNIIDQITDILDKYNPHILIINELNNEVKDTITRHSFGKYHLETDNLEVYDSKSRTGLLISKYIHYKRRKDLETPGTSTLWIQLSHPEKKTNPHPRNIQTIPKIGKGRN